jgi:hypothetical protein
VVFDTCTGDHHVLTEVYFISKQRSNIISLGQLDDIGCKYSAEDGVMTVLDRERKLLAKVRSKNRLYILNIESTLPVCLKGEIQSESWFWHARYGHISFKALKQLAQGGLATGIPKIEQMEQVCDCCLVGKQRCSPFPADSKYRADDALSYSMVIFVDPTLHPRLLERSTSYYRLMISPVSCG